MTLLDKAKEKPLIRVKKNTAKTEVLREEVEVAIAWLNDEISLGQTAHALQLGATGSPIYGRLALILREAHRRNIITIK